MPFVRVLIPTIAAVAFLAATPESRAQGSKVQSEAIQFETADAVQLQGTLYAPILDEKTKIVAANDASDAPVVILLHDYMADPNKGWDSLAISLAEKGFHVLRFDFRGHGKSTVIAKQFWDYPDNVAILRPLALKRPPPLTLEVADLKKYRKERDYFPMLVNDIMAARVAMDKKNDAGTLNTATVYLIGAGEAATLGMFYMTTEWTRPQKPTEFEAKALVALPAIGLDARSSAGKDIAGAIWLSPERSAAISERTMRDWVKTFPDLRDSNPVLCIHGEQDAAGRRMSTFIRDEMLVAKPSPASRLNKLPFTDIRTIEKSKVQGVELLNKQLGTEKIIFDYLETLEKDRKNVTKVVNRNYNQPPYIPPAIFGVR